MVRDYVKWDDTPVSLEHFAESAVRAYKIAMTPPMAPTLLILDSEMQDDALPAHGKPPIPKLSRMAPVAGDSERAAQKSPRCSSTHKSGDRGRSQHAHAGRHRPAGRARRDLARADLRPRQPHEFPDAAQVQHDRTHARTDCSRRFDFRPRADRSIQYDALLPRQYRKLARTRPSRRTRSSSASVRPTFSPTRTIRISCAISPWTFPSRRIPKRRCPI